jgi:GxxExxY protein
MIADATPITADIPREEFDAITRQENEGQVVGDYIPDLLVEDKVIVELKAIPALLPQQCLNDMRATGLRVCLLMNFGRPRLEMRRLVWRS